MRREEASAGSLPRGSAARFASAALLAGGEGRRLGGLAKEGIEGPEGPLGPSLAKRLGGFFREILVLTKDPALYAGLGSGLDGRIEAEGGGPRLLTLGDRRPGFGPLSGLHAALGASKSEWVYLAACDMPSFSPDFVAFLQERIEAAEAGATGGGERPLAALARYGSHFEPFQAYYNRALLPRLEALFEAAPEAGDRRPSFKELFAGQSVLFIPESETRRFSPDWSLFFNINTPEELERFRKAGH